MARPVLVKGSLSKVATSVLVGVGVLFVGAGVFMAVGSGQPLAGVFLGLPSVLCFAAAGLVYFLRVRGRIFLEVLPDGFVVSDRRGEAEYDDEDVRAMSTELKQALSNGVATGVRRRATLQVAREGGVRTVELDYTFPLQRADPLAELFERLQEVLLARFREQIATGRKVAGQGWHLDQEGLSIDEGSDERRYAYDELAAVSVVDGKVSVWERGRAEATIKVPVKSPNAWALVSLLNDRLPRGDAAEDLGDGMGRVIFERNKSWSMVATVIAYVIAIGLVLAGMLVAVVGVALVQEVGPLVVGLGMIAVGALFAVAAYFNRVNIFRAHSLGVTRITATGRKELRYDEVGAFTWQATRHYYNGAYTGTSMKLAFAPRSGADGSPLTFGMTIKGNDEEIDNLRDFIAQIIAGRWLAALQEGRSITWTATSTFHPDGLEHKKGWLKGGGTQVIPYSAVLNHNFKEGWLYLFGAASTKPLVQEQVNQANFFPGLALLMLILNQGGSVHPPGQERKADDRPARSSEERRGIRRREDVDEEDRPRRRAPDDDDY